jgi:hypothetical protein
MLRRGAAQKRPPTKKGWGLARLRRSLIAARRGTHRPSPWHSASSAPGACQQKSGTQCSARISLPQRCARKAYARLGGLEPKGGDSVVPARHEPRARKACPRTAAPFASRCERTVSSPRAHRAANRAVANRAPVASPVSVHASGMARAAPQLVAGSTSSPAIHSARSASAARLALRCPPR